MGVGEGVWVETETSLEARGKGPGVSFMGHTVMREKA